MTKKIARRSVLGALLLAWWEDAQGRNRLTWVDVGILAGLALAWLLEQKSEKKPKE